MKYKLLYTGDVHFGFYPAEKLYEEFQLIIKTMREERPDCVFIAGDYFDTRLSMASKNTIYAIKAFEDVLNCAMEIGCKVRQIRGTWSHDPENQLRVLAGLVANREVDYRLYLTVDEEELFPSFNMLYIPEEYMENKDEFYKEYFSKKYQGIVGHGMFEETSFSHKGLSTMKKYPIFNSKFMEELCSGPIAFGHIHTAQEIRERIRYTGSLVRSRYGEEEAKGILMAEYDTDLDTTEYTFIENEITTRFDTIEILEDNIVFTMLLNDQIHYIKELVNKYRKDNLRIKIHVPEDYNGLIPFKDSINVLFKDLDNVQTIIYDNNSVKEQNESKEKIDRLMTKYSFIFDKSITYDMKIQMFIKAKNDKDVSLETIRRLISGNK